MPMKDLAWIAVVGLAGFTVACGGSTTVATTNAGTAVAAPAGTNGAAATVPASACQANPAPAGATEVFVSQPAADAVVASPVIVSGRINAFEATFRIAIKDASGADLATKMGHSQQGQILADFNESVPFTVTAATPACLWVFQPSAKDGRPTTVLQVPITLTP
jgi:hypothetical protein